VGEGSYLLQVVRYIHKNPLRAGMVSRPELYEWSSHRGYLSRAKKWDWLHKQYILSMFAEESKYRLRRYRSFMAEPEQEKFLNRMSLKRLSPVLGDNRFVNMIKERFFEQKRHREVPESKRLSPGINTIIDGVCDLYGVDKAHLYAAKRGVFNEGRSMAVYLCRYLRGDSLTAIGKVFGIQSYSTVSSIIGRFKIRMGADRTLRRKVEEVRKTLMG
jgi:hypothetical protein